MKEILYSSRSDNWSTPEKLYNLFMDFGFYDPCPLNFKGDNLTSSWKKFNFVNPPYSKISRFVEKSIHESMKGNVVFLLIPCRTDTKYFKKIIEYGCIIWFITGRLHFSNKGSAPFPSCLIKLTGNNELKCFLIDRSEVE